MLPCARPNTDDDDVALHKDVLKGLLRNCHIDRGGWMLDFIYLLECEGRLKVTEYACIRMFLDEFFDHLNDEAFFFFFFGFS